MIYRYTIPSIPPSNNQYIGRTNNWEYQKIKKEWAGFVSIFCRPKPKEPVKKATVNLIYHFRDKRRRDPDNYSGKMILDGLVKAGILIDDNFDVITLAVSSGKVSKTNPRTEIIIEES